MEYKMPVVLHKLHFATLFFVSVILSSYVVRSLYDLEHNDMESCR
jgi:hypothetical protein